MKKKSFIILLSLCLLGNLCACGNSSEVNNIDETVNSAEVETVEEEANSEAQSVEETQEEIVGNVTEEEDVTEVAEAETKQLSDEEWFKSLNLDTIKFLVFNDVTGERKVLEDGQQYTLQEGDKIAYWYPLDWNTVEVPNASVWKNWEIKFECMFLDLNYDNITENTELALHVQDTEGKDVYATVYLSK